jgi:hypothetical protein
LNPSHYQFEAPRLLAAAALLKFADMLALAVVPDPHFISLAGMIGERS